MKSASSFALEWLFIKKDILSGMMLLFFASAFVLSPATLWTFVFYIGTLPFILFALYRKDALDWKNPCLIIAFLLIAWSAITLLWGEDPGKDRVLKYGLGAFFTAAYISGLLIELRKHKDFLHKLGSVFITMGACNILLSLVIYFFFSDQGHVSDGRLTGWAETRHPILGALVVSLSYVFALSRFLNERKKKNWHTFVVILCLIFVALTQSRGPYISVVVATFILLIAASWRQRLTVAGIMAALLSGLALIHFVLSSGGPTELVQKISERGTSHRLDIWSFTLSRIAERPWTGHGPAAYLGMGEYTFPHDLFLSTLFYNGLVGLTLLIALLGWAGFWLLKQWRRDKEAPLLMALYISGLCGGLTDLGQLTPGPAPIWLILWLPLCLIISRMPVKTR